MGAEVNHNDCGGQVRELVVCGGKSWAKGASLKNTGGCAGGQMGQNVGELIYHRAYRHKIKRHTVNIGRTPLELQEM